MYHKLCMFYTVKLKELNCSVIMSHNYVLSSSTLLKLNIYCLQPIKEEVVSEILSLIKITYGTLIIIRVAVRFSVNTGGNHCTLDRLLSISGEFCLYKN